MTLNEVFYQYQDDTRKRLTRELVLELGDNLEDVIHTEFYDLITKKHTPLWDVLLCDKFNQWARLN